MLWANLCESLGSRTQGLAKIQVPKVRKLVQRCQKQQKTVEHQRELHGFERFHRNCSTSQLNISRANLCESLGSRTQGFAKIQASKVRNFGQKCTKQQKTVEHQRELHGFERFHRNCSSSQLSISGANLPSRLGFRLQGFAKIQAPKVRNFGQKCPK